MASLPYVLTIFCYRVELKWNLTIYFIIIDLIGAVHEIGSAQTTAFAGKLNIPFTREGFGVSFL
jgi:hypothetical protein